jgi:hypothetical protein
LYSKLRHPEEIKRREGGKGMKGIKERQERDEG